MLFCFFLCRMRPPPSATRTHTPYPSTTRFRSKAIRQPTSSCPRWPLRADAGTSRGSATMQRQEMQRREMQRQKIHLVAAARPNFMKVAPLYHVLKKQDWCAPELINTGQHYDANMSATFFADLGLTAPDPPLGVGSGSHAAQPAARTGAARGKSGA